MTVSLPKRIVDAVRTAIGPSDDLVLLHGPYLPPKAREYIDDCLETGWVSSAGSFVTRFEEELARFTGVKRAIATVNGTAALEICLRLAGVASGDEVLCPSLTFVATANAISHMGAIPHFVDVCPKRLGLSPIALRLRLDEIAVRENGIWRNRQSGQKISAVCPMHCLGHPCEMQAIAEVCNEYELPVVEDAAESLGSFYNDKHTGRFSVAASISFNGNKIVTTGGGGAILTDNDELANLAKHITTTAKIPHAWEFFHDQVAWNYRLPNINAALGVAQLEVLPKLLVAKRRLHELYRDAFGALKGVRLLVEPPDSVSNYWLNAIVLEESDLLHDSLQELSDAKLQSRPLWAPMHTLPMYRDNPRGSMTATNWASQSIVNIPSSAQLAFPFMESESI
ncbi:MAG: LegC family aminotransferase [Planctomycetales bacterium]|nr:LegC family aminotransferase [Planctomycetales bacterium]